MTSDFIQRNKIVLVVALLIVIVGLFFAFKGPNDTQKLNTFNKHWIALNAPLAVGAKQFNNSYKMSIQTLQLRTVYVDAVSLNMAAKKTLASAKKTLPVPDFKNKNAQTPVQNAHDLFIAYVNSLVAVTQNVIVTAQRNGYISKLQPLVMPSTDKVTENIETAYAALGARPGK